MFFTFFELIVGLTGIFLIAYVLSKYAAAKFFRYPYKTTYYVMILKCILYSCYDDASIKIVIFFLFSRTEPCHIISFDLSVSRGVCHLKCFVYLRFDSHNDKIK